MKVPFYIQVIIVFIITCVFIIVMQLQNKHVHTIECGVEYKNESQEVPSTDRSVVYFQKTSQK